jgi:hypothetical protein
LGCRTLDSLDGHHLGADLPNVCEPWAAKFRVVWPQRDQADGRATDDEQKRRRRQTTGSAAQEMSHESWYYTLGRLPVPGRRLRLAVQPPLRSRG